jgi:hypothetical protein
MIFLEKNDLVTHSYERYIDQSSKDHLDSLEKLELQNISTIKSKLSSRYNVELIFNTADYQGLGYEEDHLGRHPLIVKVLSFLLLGDLFGRNKARKIPSDIRENYKWAKEWLQLVRERKENPTNLPIKLGADDKPLRSAIWGNNSNKNHYL